MEFWNLILAAFFVTNSLDKAESVQLEETPLKIIDEIFGEGWWDNDKAEEWHKLTLEQNVFHQNDRQNTQIGQIEPNSTDQNRPFTESDHFGHFEPNSTDQLGQIEPHSTDQNPLLTASDHSGQIEPNSTDQLGQIEPNSTDQNPSLTEFDHSDNANSSENIVEDKQKRKNVAKFHEMNDEFEQKGKYSDKERVQIDNKIAKHLKVNRTKIYKWKKEIGLNRRNPKNKRQNLIEKFDQRKAELKRDGFKNSYPNQINETVAKELGLSFVTIYAWKSEFGQTKPNHKYAHSEQMKLMKRYYEIKDKTPKISDEDIAKMLNIGSRTLCSWKKQFKRPQFHPNSVDGHSVEENAAANVEEIGNSELNE